MTNRKTTHTDAEILAATPEVLRPQVAADLTRVRHVAHSMDLIINALEGIYEIDEQCCQCGARSIRSTRDPSQAGTRTVICSKCSTADRPASYDLPQTGW